MPTDGLYKNVVCLFPDGMQVYILIAGCVPAFDMTVDIDSCHVQAQMDNHLIVCLDQYCICLAYFVSVLFRTSSVDMLNYSTDGNKMQYNAI